jgi:two-component system, OmpR family, response regulator
MRVLMIEDDPKMAGFVLKGLGQEGHSVAHAADGPSGLHMALTGSFDAAVVDVMLPGMDGLAIIDEVRRSRVRLPMLILSAKRSVDERVRGLRAGGDDYLTKPFAFSELVARLEALVRRAARMPDTTSFTVGPLEIDLARRTVTRAGMRIDLPPREFALLAYLARNAGRVVSKTMIMEAVWDYNFDPQTNVVESRVCRLRDKIDRGFDTPLLHTVRGVGYVLREDD